MKNEVTTLEFSGKLKDVFECSAQAKELFGESAMKLYENVDQWKNKEINKKWFPQIIDANNYRLHFYDYYDAVVFKLAYETS